MKKLRKILSVLTLIILVWSDFLTSISYALEDVLEDSVVVQTENEGETENVENEEENVEEENSEVVYEDESIEEFEPENSTWNIVEEWTWEVSEIGSWEVEELTEETVEWITWDVEKLTWEIVESIGTWEETVIEEIKYNEDPIIWEKTYNDVTVKVEALSWIFPEWTELKIEPIKWWDLSSLKDKLVEEKEEIKEDTTVVAFDITFKYEGEEIQPKDWEKVKVTFDYSMNKDLVKADKNKNQEIKVYHMEDKDEEWNKVVQWEEKVVDVTNKQESAEKWIAVADADSFSVYVVTYGNEDPEFSATLVWDDSARNNFHYKTITISDGTHTYTLMDRNLWARVAWDPEVNEFLNSNTWNYETESDYYGYYYQWWNSYGFSTNTTTINNKKWVIKLNAIPSNYVSSTWSNPWTPYYNEGYFPLELSYNLRWDTTNTESARQWPCPRGWHVPSANEWESIHNAWCISDGKEDGCTASEEFAKALQMPTAGYRMYSACLNPPCIKFYSCGNVGSYWSSTLNYLSYSPNLNGSSKANSLHFNWNNISSNNSLKETNLGLSVRCLKNNTDAVTLYLNPNSGRVEDAIIDADEQWKVILPTATRNEYNFDGWYDAVDWWNRRWGSWDEITINEDTDLYAHWSEIIPNPIVTFNNGADVTKFEVERGWTLTNEQIQQISNLTHTKATFDGWYTNLEFNQVFNFDTPITEDTSLYAKWTCKEWYVPLQWNGWPDMNCFEYETISYEYDGNKHILMDRNLWAQMIWFGREADLKSYGYYYQWWNNYGFGPFTTPITSNTQVDCTNINPSTYSRSTFITWSSDFDWCSPRNDNLWWWNGDGLGNNRWLDAISATVIDRQWPCPRGWHVPSAWERQTLLTYWVSLNGVTRDSGTSYEYRLSNFTRFSDDFKMPLVGRRAYEGAQLGGGGSVYLWSSSPNVDDDLFWLARHFNLSNTDFLPYANSRSYRAYGMPVRCFMNNPKTITFNYNGWEGENFEINVPSWTKVTAPADPTNGNHIFAGWYEGTDDGQTLSDTAFDFNEEITQNVDLYAKWVSCENWEIYSPELWKCVARWHELVSLTDDNTTTTVWLDEPVDWLPTTITVIENNILELPEWEELSEAEWKELIWDVTIDFGWDAKFSHLVQVKIPVTWSSKAYVKVKHVWSDEYNYDWLTTNTEASCNDGNIENSNDMYHWEYMNVESGYVSIYTCRASDFAAFGLPKLTFEPDNGSGAIVVEIESGVTVNSEDIPTVTKDGYNFSGWYLTWAESAFDFSGTAITGDITLYAKWQEDESAKYTVTFDANRWTFANLPDPQTVASWSLIYAPDQQHIPELPWYTFTGWWTEPRGGTQWDFANDIVTGNITLYAHWKYKYTFGDLDVYIWKNESITGHYTFMDRNLWATEIYDGVYCNISSDTSCTSQKDYDSYGYYYQQWNNYWFESYVNNNWALSNARTWSQGSLPSYSWSNPYTSPVFAGEGVENRTTNNNLWWWSQSDPTHRQWPCPEWYHVPNKTEWEDVWSDWSNWNTRSNNVEYISKDLLMPAASYRQRGNTKVLFSDFHHFRYLSSTYKYMFLDDNNFDLTRKMFVKADKISNGFSVRCIKDVKNEWSTAILRNIELNWWEKAIISLAEWKVQSLQEPTKSGYVFTGWYTTSDFQLWTKVVEGSPISAWTTLYAHWDINKDDTLTVYTVEHYQQNLAQTWYDFVWSGIMYWTANEQTNATGTNYEWFTLSWNLASYQTWIKADWSTVVGLYYNRDVYTVKFENRNGDVLWSGKVAYGITPEYSWVQPLRPSTEQVAYRFDGWYPEIGPVVSDITYTAVYTESTRLYTVTLTWTPTWYGTLTPELLSKEYGAIIVISWNKLTVGWTEVILTWNEWYEFKEWTSTCGKVDKQVCDEHIIYSHPDPIEFTWGNNLIITNPWYDLFSESNYKKDFEISFDIVDQYLNSSVDQATILNVKDEDEADVWPGFVVRKASGKNQIEFTARWDAWSSNPSIKYNISEVHNVKISRINSVVYISVNGEANRQLFNYSGFHTYFTKPITFGSSYKDSDHLFRPAKVTLSNILIKSVDTCYTWNVYVVTWDCQMTAEFKEIEEHPKVTVNHHWMNIGWSGYTIHETEYFSWNEWDEFTAIENVYTWFTANPDNEKTIIISGDNNSNVIDLYYYRHWWYFHFLIDPFNSAAITVSGCDNGTCWYWEDVQLTLQEETWYIFNSWGIPTSITLPEWLDRTKKTLSFTMPEINDMQIRWSVSLTAIPYTIIYHLDGWEEVEHNQTEYTAWNFVIYVTDPVKTWYNFLWWTWWVIDWPQLSSPTTWLVIVVNDMWNVEVWDREYYANWTPNKYEVTGSVAEWQENMWYLSWSTSTWISLTWLYDYATELVFIAIPELGYVFDYWKNWDTVLSGTDLWDGKNQITIVVDQILDIIAFFKPAENTPYTVEHYKQNLDQTWYEFVWSGTMYGTTNGPTNATGTNYEWFTLSWDLASYQTWIKADWSTIVRLYYDRDTYTVTWDMWEWHLNRKKTDENVLYWTTPIFEWDDEDKYTPKRWREVDTDDIKYDFIFTWWIKSWSTEIIKDLTTQIVTWNVTYTAQYDTGYRYYEVRYHPGEWTWSMVHQSLQLYSSWTLTKNTFTKTGYDFSGWWYEYGDGIEVFYEDEQEINLGVEDGVLKSGGEWEDPLYLDVYAQWKPSTDTKVTVNYYLKDLDVDNNVLIDSTTEYATWVEFTWNTDDVVDILSRYGTWIEWYEYSKSIVYGSDYPSWIETWTTTVLADGSRVIDMYYVPSIYQFTLNSESYSSTSWTSESTWYYYWAKVTLSGDSNDDCFEWSGWTTSWITLSDNTLHQTWFAMPANDVEATPSVKENTYNIIFNGNGSNSWTMSPMNGIRCTESTWLAINTFEKSWHTFTGWSTTQWWIGEYADGAIVDRLSTWADVNLYAVWDINEYNVNASVATWDHGSLQWSWAWIYEFGETLVIIAVPELGYLFDYWEVNGSTELPEWATTWENQLTIVVNQILDIVAHFTENEKTVTVNYYEMDTEWLYSNEPYYMDSLTWLVWQTKSINPESRIWFHLDDNRSNTWVTISENSEDNVINIYYERERYIIERSGRYYQMPDGTYIDFVNIIPDNQPYYQYYYGEEIRIESIHPAYWWIFSGWYDATSEGKWFPSDEVNLDSRDLTFHMPNHDVWVEPIMYHIPYTLSFTWYEWAEITNLESCIYWTWDRETYYDYSECLPYLNKEWYWFNWWDDENGNWVRRLNDYSQYPILNKMPAHDYMLVANFEPINTMPYEKYYYFQDIEWTGYTLSWDLTDLGNNGVTDQEMPGREPLYNIDWFQYSWFGYSGVMLPRDQWPIIKPIWDNYINYYYDRKVYLVDVNYDNKIMSITWAGEYRYEAPVNLVATVNTWYQFSGFSSYQGELLSSGSVYNFTMPDSFVDIYADANPIEYSIEYEPNWWELDPYSSYVNYTVESSDLSIWNPYKDGYKFLWWTWGVVSWGIEWEEDIVEPTRDLIIAWWSIWDRKYYANWEPDEVKVTVNYYLKKIDSENNTLIDWVDIYLAWVEYTWLSDDIVNIFSRYWTGIEWYHYDHAAVFSGWERTWATETTVLPDWSREINMYYIPNKYNFTLNSDLYSSTEWSSEITWYYYGAAVRLSGGSNNDCFTWSGWATSWIILSDNTVKQTLFTMPANDVEVTPSTTEKTYNIIFNGNGSTLWEMSPMNGVRCTESIWLTLNSFGKNWYTFTGWSTTSWDNIREYIDWQAVSSLSMNDWENVNLYAVWNIDWYTVTFDLNGWSLTWDMTLTTGYTIETSSISLERYIPVKSWYMLIWWYRDDTLVDHIAWWETWDYILIAHWKADSDTLYTVKYYKENLNGWYDVWTWIYTWETDIEVTALVKDFTWFTYSGWNENNVTTGVVIWDGSLVLKLYYDRNEYEVTTWEVEHGTMEWGTGSQKYGKRITFTAHPDAWYVISKWLRNENEILSGWVVWTGEELQIEVDTWMEIRVEFEAKSDTPYYVEYYKEKLEGGYEVWTWTYSGTTDQEAVAQELSFTWFTYDSWDERNERTWNIDWDGSRVLRLYYKRNTNNVVYVYTWKVPSGQVVPETTGYKYEATVIVAEAPNVLWYNFSWSTWVSSFTMPDENVVITWIWVANTWTKYAVQHMLQNIEDDGYTQTWENQILSWETDELTNAQANNYTWFIAQSFSHTWIKWDESTVVVIKYDRNEYKVTTWEVEHGTMEWGAGSQRYGKRIIFTAHPDAWYVISKWLRDGNEILSGWVIWTGEELEMKVDTWMEISVEFKAKEDTPYYVEYYKEKLEWGYDVWTWTYSGTTDQEAVAQELSFTWFTFSGWNQSNITSGVIAWDGSLVLKLFYDRNKYTITWKDGNDEVLKTDQLFYGAMPEYTGETPTKIATAQYSYTFNNTWTPAIEIVTTWVTYTAQFDVEVNKYLIIFVDGDGKIVQSWMVVYGEMPQYTWTTPTKTATAQYSYTFNNTWTPAIESVTTWVTYTAQFDSTVNEYTISIVPSDTDMWTVSPSEINVSYGSTIVESGNIITVWWVEVKATPKSADVQYTYEFDSWTNTCGSELIWTCTIQANFRKILNKYSITWMNDDWSLIDTTMVGYGVIPTHAKLTKTETEEYRYVFVWWDPEVVAVVWDAEYTAVFNAEEKEQSSNWGSMSGWGWKRSSIDNSENSDSYDNSDDQHGAAEENSDLFTWDYYVSSWNIDEETLSLYEWAHENDITTIDTLEDANADGYLTRWHMAKIAVNFAEKILWKTVPDVYPDECNWNDKESERESQEIKIYAKKACALWVMWINVDEFMPNKILNRAEFGTTVSRLLWWDRYNIIDTDHRFYYEDHLYALKKQWIMTQINDPEDRRELRKWVRLVFRRITEKLRK